MTLSPEERTAINRQNARRSTGPKSTEGKSVVRWNALKHGLRADADALPNEDPAVAEARAAAWNDFYQPQSPTAQHLVNECVRVTLLADRVARFYNAAVSEQVVDADLMWQNDRAAEVRDHIDRLRSDPADARRGLEETADGCRWLIGRWERLRHALDMDGRLTHIHRAEALRLMGCRPGRDLKRDPFAWEVWVLITLTSPSARDAELSRAFAPEQMPEAQRPSYTLDDLPRYDRVLKRLDHLLETQLAELRATADRLHATVDLPARAAAADRALLLEGTRGRLFLRYHSESRTTFHRASRALENALQSDRDAQTDEADELDAAFSPNEANSDEASDRGAAFSPNEANADEASGRGAEVSPNKANFEPAAGDCRPDDSTQTATISPVTSVAIEMPRADEFGEVARQVARVDPRIEPMGVEDGGAARVHWGWATGATSPQTDLFPFSGLCPGFDTGVEVVPGASFSFPDG